MPYNKMMEDWHNSNYFPVDLLGYKNIKVWIDYEFFDNVFWHQYKTASGFYANNAHHCLQPAK